MIAGTVLVRTITKEMSRVKTAKYFVVWSLLLGMALGSVNLVAEAVTQKSKQAMPIDELVALWKQRAAESQAEKVDPIVQGDTQNQSITAAGPNALVHGAPPSPAGENNNSSVSWSETIAGEVYTTFNELAGPGPAAISVGHAFSAAGGVPGSWINLGPVPPAFFPLEYNATISAHPFGGFMSVSVALLVAPPVQLGASGIQINANVGGGAPFPPPIGPPIMMAAGGVGPGTDWVDYPFMVVNDDPASPAPEFGTAHMAWVHYFDGDGDPDGDGNPFDDPADTYEIMYAYSNTLAGAILFPAVSLAVPISPILPINAPVPQDHRPAVDFAGPGGTPLVPAGGLYVAHFSPLAGGIFLHASPAPGAGAPFAVLPAGPIAVPIGPPIPPVIPAGPPILATSGVGLVVDKFGPCPGSVYICWADMTLGDGDIWFSSSADGGLTWKPPVRVNCDPTGTGAMQWAPKMVQDPNTGDICILYNDQRSAPGAGVEVWASTSRDCGVTWVDGLVSDMGSVPALTTFAGPPGPAGAGWAGDYLGADFGFTFMTPPAFSFNDARNGADQDVIFETVKDIDFDCDGFPSSIDCDDTDPTIFPGAVEVCDGIDNNCDLVVDEGFDVDGDGFTTCAGDCDDGDPSVFPGAPEIMCDGIDNDCDPATLDDVDADGDGVSVCAGDCDDSDPTVFPGGTEVCDGVDNNCNSLIDEGFDADSDGFTTCAGDCDDADPSVFPGAIEICDGLDNDCDAIIDNVGAVGCTPYFTDADGDGFGDPSSPLGCLCSAPPSSSTNNTDCDDSDPSVFPGAIETCDGLDNNCNSLIDEGLLFTDYWPDSDGDGFGDASALATSTCSGPPTGFVANSVDCDDSDPAVNPSATEDCGNGIDDDCNSLIDAADPACATGCCVTPGDFNHDGAFNIADVTAGIARIFGGGAAPFCQDEADFNSDNTFNIADVTAGIARIFAGGAAPVCGTTGT